VRASRRRGEQGVGSKNMLNSKFWAKYFEENRVVPFFYQSPFSSFFTKKFRKTPNSRY